jgi:hypothetical protein
MDPVTSGPTNYNTSSTNSTNTTGTVVSNSTASGNNGRIESAAMSAHQKVDNLADGATARVDRLSGTAHRAVNKTADAASAASEWASSVPDQARRVQSTMSESACNAVRTRPLSSVAGALAIGYLLGRLARL